MSPSQSRSACIFRQRLVSAEATLLAHRRAPKNGPGFGSGALAFAQTGSRTFMSIQALKDEIARQFGTPAVVIDLDVVERNIARVQALCDAAGIANRPHIKTHKSPVIAAMQRDAGARGITCQKLGEAEVMAEAGHDDILISYNILGEEKLDRLAALMRRARITVAADNPVTVAGLPRAAGIAGR